MAMTEADRQEQLLRIESNYALGETTGGIALIVLTILALAKVDPMLLNAIAVIVAGVALLIEDGVLTGQFGGMIARVPADRAGAGPTADRITAGTLAGVSGVVLGILAILGIASVVLTAAAIIIFGAAVLFDFSARARTAALRTMSGESSEQSVRIAFAAPGINSSAMLVSLALITLGILALAGLVSSILVTVGLLGFGGYLFLQNAAMAGSFLGTAY
ncbi:MAG: hypothetical protein JO166_02925 [Deltaproteobacteria bacterium]|nr:hypothetical protein [Deltaproteobacteria bacterium]